MFPAALLDRDRDPRLWDTFEWSELAPETHAAIAHFERQLRPAPVIEWLEDVRMPRLSSRPRRRGLLTRLTFRCEP